LILNDRSRKALKMEQPNTAHQAGSVSNLKAEVGATVTNGAVICHITDSAEPA
jgi:acetyl-CoA/propionyl-CoA carboxylase biotin carboxyl carrier protein